MDFRTRSANVMDFDINLQDIGMTNMDFVKTLNIMDRKMVSQDYMNFRTRTTKSLKQKLSKIKS